MKIFQAFIVLASAIAAATGAAVRPAYGAPVYAQPSYDEPASYTYSYGVNDGYSGANFNADESRDGYATKGSYSVALPDGRVQTVTYNVDGYNGYVADVSYTGEAQYPEYHAPAVYKADPVYAAPSYGYRRPAYHA